MCRVCSVIDPEFRHIIVKVAVDSQDYSQVDLHTTDTNLLLTITICPTSVLAR